MKFVKRKKEKENKKLTLNPGVPPPSVSTLFFHSRVKGCLTSDLIDGLGGDGLGVAMGRVSVHKCPAVSTLLKKLSQAWWCMLMIPALRRLGSTTFGRAAWAAQ